MPTRHSAAIDHSLIVRLTGIRPEIPNYLRTRTHRDGIYAVVRALQRKIVPLR